MPVQFKSNLGEVKKGMEQQGRAALMVIGGKAETYAKQLCKVKTNRLRASITHQLQGDLSVAIGTNVYYAPYVELGHAQQPGRYVPAIGKRLVKSWVDGKPFIRPAIEEHKDEYKEIVEQFMKG